jgi:hypothetical protein
MSSFAWLDKRLKCQAESGVHEYTTTPGSTMVFLYEPLFYLLVVSLGALESHAFEPF